MGHGQLTVGAGEIDQPESQGGRSRGDSANAPLSLVVGDGGELGAAGLEVDDDTGKDSPGLVDDGSRQGYRSVSSAATPTGATNRRRARKDIP